MSQIILNVIKKYLYKAIWRIEKKLKSKFSIENSRPKVDIIQENEFSPEFQKFTKNLKLNPQVLGGPFIGLKYPRIKSFGSSIYPKLIGTYEAELAESIKFFSSIDYDKIFVIGCAEGYYCNGLGLISKDSSIYCFDINDDAIKACREMSKINNLSNKVKSFNEEFTVQKYKIKKEEKILIICDIEGEEEFLFSPENIENFNTADLIIECHDYRSVGLTNKLKLLFSKTHNVENIKSIDDLYRPIYLENDNYVPKELSYNEQYRLMKEYRKAQMSWLILTKKNFN